MTGKVVSVQNTVIFYWYYAEFWPISTRLPILHIGRYVSARMITDTDILVLPIWAISADISYRPIPICQPWFWAWIWSISGYFCPISWVLGLDLAHFEQFLPYFGGFWTWIWPILSFFWGFRAWIWLILGLLRWFWTWIWPISGHFCPIFIPGVLVLDLAHFGPQMEVLFPGFLPYFGSSEPGFGTSLSYLGDSGPEFGPFCPIGIDWLLMMYYPSQLPFVVTPNVFGGSVNRPILRQWVVIGL